jgi:hypothetical protein
VLDVRHRRRGLLRGEEVVTQRCPRIINGGSKRCRLAFMKTNRPDENREPLSDVLREWSMTTPVPPRFRDAVWQRIARQEGRGGTLLTLLHRWLETVLPRPKVALSYVTVLLLIGTVSGLWTARVESDHLNAALGSRYLHAVDPYQTVASNP